MVQVCLADARHGAATATGEADGRARVENTTEALGGGATRVQQFVITLGGDEPDIELLEETAPSLAAGANRGPIFILKHAHARAPGMLAGESAGAATVVNANDTGAGRHMDPERRSAPALSLENMMEGILLAYHHLAFLHINRRIADLEAQLAALQRR